MPGPPVAEAETAEVCLPSAEQFARDIGLSPAELQLLQSLGERRGELDAREESMDVQLQLLLATEEKVDDKIATLQASIQELKVVLGQVDEQQAAEEARLIKVYETMGPKDAAPQLASMSDGVRLPILARMNERRLAAILAEMAPAQAREITEKLAARTIEAFAVPEARAAAAETAAAPRPAPASTEAAPG